MRNFFLLILLVIPFALDINAQSREEKEVAAAVELFRKGIVAADESQLKSIASEKLVYGHSNGRVQNKKEFLEEIVSMKPFDYVTAEISEQTVNVSGETAVVRHVFSSQTTSNGTSGSIKIGVMQIWQKQEGTWKLLARQAYKLP